MTPFRRLTAAFTLCALTFPAMAADKPPEVLKGGSWTMDYAADSCRLARSFGDPADPVLLVMEFTQPSSRYQLVLVGERFATKNPRPEVKLQWGPSDHPAVVRQLNSGRLGQTPMLLGGGPRFDNDDDGPASQAALSDAVPFASAQEEAAARMLVIGFGDRTITLETGSMHAPMDAVRACVDKLVESWGLDPAQQKALSRYPTPVARPSNWITTSSYPPAALRSGEQARVNFRLIVDANGKPEKCNVQSATVGTGFEEASCGALMRRARFKPALDAQGNPVRSYYVSSVTWINP